MVAPVRCGWTGGGDGDRGHLRIAVPVAPLSAGIGVLTLVTPVTFWRRRQEWHVGEAEAFGHMAFDILLLGWALYFTGGASNPFITLLLVPVALSAAALSVQATAGVTALAAMVYGALIFVHVPLPDMPMHGNAFRLHLTGMTVNFMIAVLLLAVFIGHMHASLTAQREAIGQLRGRWSRRRTERESSSSSATAVMASRRVPPPVFRWPATSRMDWVSGWHWPA